MNQYDNLSNRQAHYETTGPEIWEQTDGKITHYVTTIGTGGTVMGVAMYLKEKNPEVRIIGAQPTDGSSIPGIRRWPAEYLPKIYEKSRVDEIMDVSQANAELWTRELSQKEGVFAGVSSGGAVYCALELAKQLKSGVIVAIICDRGDRYLSGPVFA